MSVARIGSIVVELPTSDSVRIINQQNQSRQAEGYPNWCLGTLLSQISTIIIIIIIIIIITKLTWPTQLLELQLNAHRWF